MRVPILVVAGTLLATGAVYAHHPFAEEFDVNAPVHLTGKVTQVVWNNPHVMIHMTEAGDRAWTLEAASPDNLLRKGWTRDTLKAGDQITVEGFRAKSEPMTAAARVVELPGGKKMSAADDLDGGPKSPVP
jgi:Family of unknown function (DUF6152)